jgi:hypothetical protein
MPDTGDFDRHNEPQGATLAWGDAFVALPQDAPDAGGWQRVQARLPALTPRARVRWPLWLAAAASLVVAVAIPLRMLPQAEPPAAATVAQVTVAPGLTQSVAPPHIAIEAPPVSMPVAQSDTRRQDARVAPSRRPIRTAAPPAEATHVATVDAPPITDLEPLYAQSAQLESLLAMARDERMANGTSAALTDGLDARLGSIDAALVEPGLDAQRRAELWGHRVDALQQLVGIEATQRLYAARGQSYQAALVSID